MLLFGEAATVGAAALAGLRGEERSASGSRSVLRSTRFGGDLVIRPVGSDNSFKHVVGVSKRKSHG